MACAKPTADAARPEMQTSTSGESAVFGNSRTAEADHGPPNSAAPPATPQAMLLSAGVDSSSTAPPVACAAAGRRLPTLQQCANAETATSALVDPVAWTAHSKMRRLKLSTLLDPVAQRTSDVLPAIASTSAVFAIVPAYPNELTLPLLPRTQAHTAGSAPAVRLPSTSATCGLSTRSCAFGEAAAPRSCISSFSTPASPAPGSVCPAFAFRLPMSKGPIESRCARRTAAAEPASIGSPSAVPVPCASSTVSCPAPSSASSSDATSMPCCACPLGAVRLALRPS